jgi:hypothetical protein
MAYHRLCDKSNMTGATVGAGTGYPSEAYKFTPIFFFWGGGGVCAQCLVLCVVLGRSLFVLLAIVLAVLPFTASDHPFGIYKPISYLQISS